MFKMSSILCKSLPGDILHWGHSGDYTGKDCTLDGGREIGRENPWQVDIHSIQIKIRTDPNCQICSPGQGVARSESESRGGVALTALFKQNQLR